MSQEKEPMLKKIDVIQKARAFGFDEIGFTTAEPFQSHREVLLDRKEAYSHYIRKDFSLIKGVDPQNLLPGARSIIVLVHWFLKESFDPFMETHFGKFYIDEDRIFKKEMIGRVIDFVEYLRKNGIKALYSRELPHRASAGRAGIGRVGKNCLMYSRRDGYESSRIILSAIMVDQEFEPDDPQDEKEFGCPEFCRNTCIAACPTGALNGPRHLDPRRCISYMTFHYMKITPLEMRIPMGLWVYGCDRCQNVCPRNDPWGAKDKPVNQRVAAKKSDFHLPTLLHMDEAFFKAKIWPHMFYIDAENLWLWKMNVARVMGNTCDQKYLPDLIRAYNENTDERLRGMIAWSLGRVGGKEAGAALEGFLKGSEGLVRKEIEQALEMR
jgi:epoxyqueuosine reductase